MKLRRLAIIVGFLLSSFAVPLQAADMMSVYYQALGSDPTFKKANADWESAKENLPIARAAYLTQIALTGNAQRQFNNLTPPIAVPPPSGYNYDYGYTVNLTQPIFNLPAWNAIKSAKAAVKAATATFASASQDLMARTVKAYVAVLQAYDQLRYTLARKRAVKEQLIVSEQQFKVGLIAITAVYDTRSSYDQAVATSISDQNQLNDAVERLAEITSIHYRHVRGIGKRVPLIKPKPNDINAWADVAECQNYALIAQNYTVIAARDTIKQQSTAWLPQLNLAGTYVNDNQTSLSHIIPRFHRNNVLYGATLNFPLIQGGAVLANTKQARYNYLSASSERETIYRSVVSNTRQSFLGVITGISKIKADWQTVLSNQNKLEATKAGYQVGTRTMVDVLIAVTDLYQAQQQYSDDQYRYIIDTVELKFNAGTLCVDDLQKINSWFKQNITLNLPKEALKALQSRLRPLRPLPHELHHVKKQSVKKRFLARHHSIKKIVKKRKHTTIARAKKPTLVARPKLARHRRFLVAHKVTRRRHKAKTVAHRVPRKPPMIALPAPTATHHPSTLALPAPKQMHIVSLDERIIPLYGRAPV